MATILSGKGTFALAAFDGKSGLKKHEFGRPAPGPKDVAIAIQYCGMCHSDVHATNGDWGINKYPMAPGHEVAGVVTAVGSEVKDIKVGDKVGVGCHVESCGSCDDCKNGLHQHCPKHLDTYGSDWTGAYGHDECKGYTNGGYSTAITVNRTFVFPIPEGLDMKYVGPLLCAGITTYSPLARHVLDKKDRAVGVVGFGGLGHVAIKIAKAMGAKVFVFSRSLEKKAEAATIGATIVSTADPEALKAMAGTLHCIIDTVSAHHDIASIMNSLKTGGAYVMLGGVAKPYDFSAFALLMHRWSIEGSLTGGAPETLEMLQFCAKHKILPDVKVIAAKDAPEAYRRLEAGEAPAARHVIDMSTIKDM